MPPSPSEVLLNICATLGIDVRGFSDDQLDMIAIKITVEDIVPVKSEIERIIADFRRAEGSGQETGVVAPQEPALPSRGYRFNATEATNAKYRERLARAHRTEDARTGLYLVPRRPEVMRAGAVHPACKAAYADDATPCVRCIPLLHPATCECDPCMEWWARMDA